MRAQVIESRRNSLSAHPARGAARVALLVVASTLALQLPAAAAPRAPDAVLLPVEGEELAPTLMEELERSLSKFGKPVQRSTLKLDDLMIAVGCVNTSVACLQKIGRIVKARSLILVELKKSGDSLDLSLRGFDVKTGGDSGRARRHLPVPSASPSAEAAQQRADTLDAAVAALLGLRVPPPRIEPVGVLLITSSVPSVEIVLDGKRIGVAPLRVRELRAGTHGIEGRREGYIAWQGTVEVRADQTEALHVEMVATAPGYIESIRRPTWAMAGAGLATLIIASAFAAHLKATQDEFDQIEPVTRQQIARMQSLRSEGTRDALAANICFGISAAALVGAGVLSYLDYRRARGGTPGEEAPAKTTTRWQAGPAGVRLDVRF